MATPSSAQLQGMAPSVFSCAIALMIIAATGSRPLMTTLQDPLRFG